MEQEILKVTDNHLGQIETVTGKIVDLNHPNPELICVDDIAIPLHHIVRFGGHLKVRYTVAHHSLLMSYLVPDAFALHALLHDASEAYLGDVIKPLKNIISDLYTPIEKKWESAIYEWIGLEITEESTKVIKEADLQMLLWEQKYVRNWANMSWHSALKLFNHSYAAHEIFQFISCNNSYDVYQTFKKRLIYLAPFKPTPKSNQ